jgi:hypothetical protein
LDKFQTIHLAAYENYFRGKGLSNFSSKEQIRKIEIGPWIQNQYVGNAVIIFKNDSRFSNDCSIKQKRKKFALTLF